MTNEEKAKELDEKFKSFLYSPKEGLSFQQCLLEMAEWKDKQYAKVFAPILIELDELKHQIKLLLP